MAGDVAPRYVSSWDRATHYLIDAAGLTVEQLRTAIDVLRAIAETDLRPLERAMTCGSMGNPITFTPEQTTAWSTYCEAADVRDRAHAWASAIDAATTRADVDVSAAQ